MEQALAKAASFGGAEDAFTEAFAARLDAEDPLARFRSRFHMARVPPHDEASAEAVYLCGNSLGLQPLGTEPALLEELAKWKRAGVEGHFQGRRPWATIDERVVPLMAPLLGASPEEVAIMNSLSVNLHLLLVAFYRPTDARHKIIMEASAFCSDHHVVRSQLAVHGRAREESLVLLEPREGETALRTEDVVAAVRREGASLSLVMLPGVQFLTGQAFDMRSITAAAHEAGAYAGFDLAHAAGNIELSLHEWDVDFAAFCTYKYLNAGPGSIGGIFLHERHSRRTQEDMPRLCGWWGQRVEDRFAMSDEWRMLPGAQSFQMSNPAVVAAVCLEASLEVFAEATMPAVRQKSVLLTGYLEALLRREAAGRVTVATPADPAQRGAQLSLVIDAPVKELNRRLLELGVICDVREPNTMRVSPAPLYNSFSDVYLFVRRLVRALAETPRVAAG